MKLINKEQYLQVSNKKDINIIVHKIVFKKKSLCVEFSMIRSKFDFNYKLYSMIEGDQFIKAAELTSDELRNILRKMFIQGYIAKVETLEGAMTLESVTHDCSDILKKMVQRVKKDIPEVGSGVKVFGRSGGYCGRTNFHPDIVYFDELGEKRISRYE